jgi:hypothetical protein
MKTQLFRRTAPMIALLSAVCIMTAPAAEPTTPAIPAATAATAATATGKTVRVLTIGNSFSQNATKHLGDLAEASGDTLVLKGANVGGASMELHWSKAEAFEKDPKNPTGLYGGKGLRELLAADRWDFVTIQQASIKSHDLANYRPFAARLAEYVHRYAPNAELVIHQTWEYRSDDPRFTKPSSKPGEPKTHVEMYEGLSRAYTTIADELGIRRLPVGDAFHLAGRDETWGFRPTSDPFDPKRAQPGELPKQVHSLHVGWIWRKSRTTGKPALGMDGHHANQAGEYLGACVWYERMFGKDVTANRFVPNGLDAEFARFLRATAHQAVAQELARERAKSGDGSSEQTSIEAGAREATSP